MKNIFKFFLNDERKNKWKRIEVKQRNGNKKIIILRKKSIIKNKMKIFKNKNNNFKK